MKTTHFLLASTSVFAFSAVGALAQNFYAGLGFESGQREETQLGTFEDSYSAASVIGGYRYGFSSGLFLGAEGEVAFSGEFNGNDIELWRARAIFGKEFGKFALFGAIGYAESKYQGSTESYTGTTYGIGGEYAVNDRIGVRLEAIKDDLNSDQTSSYTWDDKSVRAGAVVKF